MGLREEFEAWLLTDYRNDLYGAFEAGWNRRASPASVQEGWKLVPAEPTKEMIKQACKDHGYSGGDRSVYARGYRSMLAAAPTTPVSEDRWLPIKTAPKDSSYVLLAGKRREDIASGYWLQSAYAGNGAWIWPFVHKSPTHWMPLPKAPAMEGK